MLSSSNALHVSYVCRECADRLGADTEIDWQAYMEEVGGFLSGNWDYEELKGALISPRYCASQIQVALARWCTRLASFTSTLLCFGLLREARMCAPLSMSFLHSI